MSDLRSITKFWDAAPLVGDIPEDAKILIGIGNNVFRVTKAELEAQVGGGGGDAVTWDTLGGKPAVIGAGATAAAARTAIGAGTGNSNLALGSTGTTAAAGNHNHDGVYATQQALADLVSRVEDLENPGDP